MTFLRLTKDFVCLGVMDLTLKFQILKKFETNSKSKTLKNTENQLKSNFHLLWPIKWIYTRWDYGQLQTSKITTNAPKPRKYPRINHTRKINFHF